MNCQKAVKIIFLSVDNELEDAPRQELDEHLTHCPHCARRLVFTHKLLIVVRKRCTRRSAPKRLRRKILTSLPHRRQEWA